MKIVNVEIQSNNDKSYPIYIGSDMVSSIDEVLARIAPKKILIVTNENIFELYGEKFPELFKRPDISLEYCILPDGEIYKNQTSLEIILACAFEAKLERNDVFVAFGGGVIGDMTGFAAAIYLRGINFIQVPTTILAQVDSSVGGKVAINTPYGKNLLGAFYQPKAVFSDINYLKTLPKKEILAGLSEVVKYSFIEKSCNTEFTDFAKFLYANQKAVARLDNAVISQMIETCCKLKAAVVNQDEKEKGLRAILNFGHTIGHAIEKSTDFSRFTHGEAVAIGMKGIFFIALRLGKINEEYFNFAMELLNSFGLSYSIPKDVPAEKIIDALSYDKKVRNGKIRFVLPVGYGKVEISEDVPKDLIADVLKELY